MKFPLILAASAALLAPAVSLADSGKDIYESRCSLCHAGGAGGAPKFKNREDWAPRVTRGRLALYDTALHGKPNTAMMPRGGVRDLSDPEGMSAVDYMVEQTGFKPGLRPQPAPAAPAPEVAQVALAPAAVPAVADAPAAAPAAFDDDTATARIAEALRAQLAAPDAKVEMHE